MTDIRRYLLLILIALCGITWTACTQQRSPCGTPKNVNLSIETLHKTSDTATVFFDTSLPSAVFIPITKTSPRENLYLQQQATFSLTLSPDTPFCQWAFRPDTLGLTYDTISFYYQRIPEFLSNACGYTFFYTLDSIHHKGNIIDSIYIISTSVTNNATARNLQIYIHPDF